ncbi:retinol dehydrogenase 12-like [Patiria miniata]|uniref:Retinol dehydrogenase 13 n=1 Tax=Patiria miniata TaxID=46514 RepID=A0A914BC82_PATMI|nr:retinol dehydrogenase 12-like [Patiria miniata]XP_038073446.1 retinol dehydrogenase 12-like [Patiria miniata]XP_038073447.1 retinol dehydrogenase 12-like [Patiria miniata]
MVDVFGMSVDPLLVASFIVVGVVMMYLLSKYSEGGWCYSKARLDGKTVLITGANTGIGKETARDLARRGARVILACRDLAKAEAAMTDIREDTGNSNLAVVKLDLASLASVRECAEKIKREESRLDILINNAGIMMCPEWQTEDGFEMQFGVNHLGHFLLTNLLLDLIKSSTPARIVNVSSLAHEFGKMNWEDIHMRTNYHPIHAYGQSKLANVLFTRELSKRLKDTSVNVFALHPGNVKTELTRYTSQSLGLLFRIIFMIAASPLGRIVMKTAVQGAQTSIHCAVEEELADKSGLYFSDCAVKNPGKRALDEESARRMWELSAEMVGLEKKVE